MEDAEEGAGEEGRARGAGPELRGVQDCGGIQVGERMNTKFRSEIWSGRAILGPTKQGYISG